MFTYSNNPKNHTSNNNSSDSQSEFERLMDKWSRESNFSTYSGLFKIHFDRINEYNRMYYCVLPIKYYLLVHGITDQCMISLSESQYSALIKYGKEIIDAGV